MAAKDFSEAGEVGEVGKGRREPESGGVASPVWALRGTAGSPLGSLTSGSSQTATITATPMATHRIHRNWLSMISPSVDLSQN